MNSEPTTQIDSEEGGGVEGRDSGSLDLDSASAIIQQQQAQIQALLQQRHQLQNQANSLLAPALQVSVSLSFSLSLSFALTLTYAHTLTYTHTHVYMYTHTLHIQVIHKLVDDHIRICYLCLHK